MTGYNVYIKYNEKSKKWIDRVFYNGYEDTNEVRRSLIDHDGYDPRIIVIEEKKEEE